MRLGLPLAIIGSVICASGCNTPKPVSGTVDYQNQQVRFRRIDQPELDRAVAPLVGTWKPIDKEGRSNFTKAVIRTVGDRTMIQVWSRRTRSIVAWPEVDLTLFGATVEAKTFDHGMAKWTEDFGVDTWFLNLNGDRLRVDSYSTFTDDSGRTNYTKAHFFRRTKEGADRSVGTAGK